MSKVLRASKAGFPCDRNLWYSVNDYAVTSDESDSATTIDTWQRILDVGTCLEPLIVEWLRQEGWEVEYNPGSQNADVEIHVALDGGELAGHPDCIISRGDLQNVLVDIKTMNDRSFTTWRREGTLKSKPQYADQVHIYAAGLKEAGRKIEHLGIVGLNKNNSELHIDLFDFDEARLAGIVERSERVIKAAEAPETDSPRESWCCSYCEYADICGLHSKPNPADGDAEIEYTEDAGIIGALHELKDARELAKDARDKELEAKSVIDEYIKTHGNSRIAGGGLMFSLTEHISGRFDSASFKKDYPELAGQYTKTSTSLFYEVKEAQ